MISVVDAQFRTIGADALDRIQFLRLAPLLLAFGAGDRLSRHKPHLKRLRPQLLLMLIVLEYGIANQRDDILISLL